MYGTLIYIVTGMYVLSRPCARSSGRYYQVTLQYGAGKARLAYQVHHVFSHCDVCLLSSAEARRHPSEEYMLHAWLVDQLVLLVAEPIKVAQMTAKHNRVPAAFRSST